MPSSSDNDLLNLRSIQELKIRIEEPCNIFTGLLTVKIVVDNKNNSLISLFLSDEVTDSRAGNRILALGCIHNDTLAINLCLLETALCYFHLLKGFRDPLD